MNDSITDYVALQSLGHRDFTIRFSVAEVLDKIEIIAGDGKNFIKKSMLEVNDIGRINIDGLQPDTEYQVVFRAGKYRKDFYVKTLPEPEGKALFSYAVISDPHIAVKGENRNGRLHCESHGLFREMIYEINQENIDFLFLPGDITDSGVLPEFESVSGILGNFNGKLYMTPGNHDVVSGEIYRMLWSSHFGKTTCLDEYKGWQIVCLDTSDECLNKKENLEIIERLNMDKPCLLISHYQLFPDNYITCADRHIRDADKCHAALNKLSGMSGMMYIGHKNIASRVNAGNMIQLNVPQVTHFPAGYIKVHVHSNGLYHRFCPIYSELLNEYSRKCWVRNGISMNYRDGNSFENWNFRTQVDKIEKVAVHVS